MTRQPFTADELEFIGNNLPYRVCPRDGHRLELTPRPPHEGFREKVTRVACEHCGAAGIIDL